MHRTDEVMSDELWTCAAGDGACGGAVCLQQRLWSAVAAALRSPQHSQACGDEGQGRDDVDDHLLEAPVVVARALQEMHACMSACSVELTHHAQIETCTRQGHGPGLCCRTGMCASEHVTRWPAVMGGSAGQVRTCGLMTRQSLGQSLRTQENGPDRVCCCCCCCCWCDCCCCCKHGCAATSSSSSGTSLGWSGRETSCCCTLCKC